MGNHTEADESVESKDGEKTDGKEKEKKNEKEIPKDNDTNKPRRPVLFFFRYFESYLLGRSLMRTPHRPKCVRSIHIAYSLMYRISIEKIILPPTLTPKFVYYG